MDTNPNPRISLQDRRRSIIGMILAPVVAGLAMALPKRAAAEDAKGDVPGRGTGHARTVQDRLDMLESREQIKELRARYAWHAVRGEGAKMADLFTDDCVLDASVTEGHRMRVEGKAALQKMLANVKPAAVIPTNHNHIIEIDGHLASGTVVMETRVSPYSPTGFVCFYDDRLRRENGQWLFTSRKYYMYNPFYDKT